MFECRRATTRGLMRVARPRCEDLASAHVLRATERQRGRQPAGRRPAGEATRTLTASDACGDSRPAHPCTHRLRFSHQDQRAGLGRAQRALHRMRAREPPSSCPRLGSDGAVARDQRVPSGALPHPCIQVSAPKELLPDRRTPSGYSSSAAASQQAPSDSSATTVCDPRE